MLVSDVTNPFYFGIIRGTQQQLKAAGYTQILVDTEESDELEDGMLHKLRRSFDGAILAASRLTDRRLTALAGRAARSSRSTARPAASRASSSTPRTASSRRSATSSRSGTRDIAYVSGPETSWPNEGRWRAMVRGRGSATASTCGDSVRSRPRQYAGAAAADAVLHAGVTACIAFNDLLAIGMLARASASAASTCPAT